MILIFKWGVVVVRCCSPAVCSVVLLCFVFIFSPISLNDVGLPVHGVHDTLPWGLRMHTLRSPSQEICDRAYEYYVKCVKCTLLSKVQYYIT